MAPSLILSIGAGMFSLIGGYLTWRAQGGAGADAGLPAFGALCAAFLLFLAAAGAATL